MIKIYDINDKLLMQAEVTSAAKREQEMSKSDYISLSFSAAEKVILPIGAYINYTYKIDKVREVTRKFLLLESYEPTQSDECSWKYTPLFQHPKMILSKTPFFIYIRNSQNVEVKQNVWSFVGTTSVLSGKIADFLNKDLMFGECGWKVIFSNVTANTVNVSFSDNDFISALTAITNAIGDNCEWHIDYDDEIIYIGKVLIGATPVVLEVGKNVGVPSINNSKEGYYNAFSIFGGTRNITQVNSKGENVSSGDIRLQLDEGNGTILIDGKERSYSIDKYSTLDLRADKTKEPLFTKVLDFSQIFPSLNTYVYNVRGRVKYVLDEKNNKIPISNADGSIKEYKTFTVWYMRLAYPTTEKITGKTIINTTVDDGITHYWYDFEVTDDLRINGKNIGCSFEPNFNTGALSTPLAGQGTNGDYVGFELTYHKEASSSHTSDDVSASNFSILAGDYEIIYQEDNEVIIPTNAADMLIPRGESKPSLKCNITVLYNIAMADTIYYEDAQNRLLEKAKEEIVRLLSDLNNYEVKSYSDVFLEDNPQLQIGQSITYKDGHGYELATRVLKLSTNIDYDFIQSITIGNQVIKGTITQLKEDVQTIIASGGSSGNGGGYSVSQLRKLIAKYGSDNFISKQFDDIAKGTITWEKLQKFLKGMKVGANGDWTLDELDNTHLTTDYLQVRMKAIFETLEILHTDTLGGELFITPVGSNRILKVEEVNITYDGVSQKAYRCYFLGEQDGSKVENKWKVGDQARSKSFNLTAGKYHNVGNHYYWRLVIGVSSEAVEIDGKKYHYVDLSDIDKDAASDEPMVDDILNQCGNRTNITRQSCLVFSAVDTYSPCITLYHGVDGYTFNNKEYVNYGVNHSTNKAFFHVYGDMYFGDRPTSANNYEGESYVKFDSETKKVTIKGELDIKSTYDGKTLDKYIADKRRIFGSQPVPPYDVNDMWVNATYPSDGSTYKNEILKCSTAKAEGEKFDIADWKLASKYTDDTKAEEAKKAAEKAQEEIKTTQSNLNTLGTTVSNNKKAFDDFTSDGYLDSSEIAAIAQDSKRLEDDYNAAVESYNNVVGSKFLLDKDGNETTYKTDLVSAKATLDSAKNELITYLSDIVSRYNASDSNGKATIKAAAAQKYTNFTNAYKAFYDKLGVANNYITSNLFDGLNTKLITNMAGLEYIKAALVDGDTVVKGGLILSTLIALRNDKGNVTAGINGADTKENGIALWLGGKAIDKQASTTTEEEKKIAAKSLLRFDGTGYFANGNLWWDADGILHADPTSFIINKNNVGVQLALFAPIWKSGTTDTTKLANVLSIDPQKPFTHLDVSGNVTTEGSLKIGGIYLSYDSANNALRLSKDAAGKEAANFYALGGITAYGKGAGTTGGGGLNASVISYARIIKGDYTDADLTSIPNAYAIKALSSRIDNIATELGGLNLSWNNITGKPSTFTPSAHTHKWTEITDRITKVSQLTNDKGYLTAHQSLASYYTKAEIDAKGYTTNKGTVTSVALTLPTGLTCATKTITTSGTFAISLASGYSIPTTAKQTAWDGAVSAKHTHSNKSVLDGITSTKVTCWDSAYDWYALITTDEETADGVINKWNEVVSFLANIAQTDTLSGIVDGINKSISDEVTRAKKAEGVNASGISTNKTSITTLQGYFTSGSAKKALQLTNTRKLWGNSFNGTADINGSIIVPDGKYISIGNIKMEYDATNKALKITNTTTNEVANLYTSGGVSAYGVGTSSSSGGGLNASVISYARIIKGDYTDADLTSIPNAYAIKALSSRIDNIATELGGLNLSWNNITGKPSTFTPSAHTHKWTEITDRITKVSQLTNDKGYLTAHQSLASYYTKAEIDAKGYTTNKGTVTSVALTLPTGLTCATKTITTSGTFAISLASGYSIPTTAKQTAWDGAVSAKHTHSNKSVLDGITSTKVTCWDSAYDWYALITTDEETADGVINKWNEVVSFLANIAQTDTLSGIVDGINKSISDEVTRAKKAEGVNASGISTNKTSITTLQGYFTSGSAKKALQLTNTRKLWGNSFNGTADINGSIIVPDGKYISIGNIKMEYDATNKALKITNTTTNEVANLYTSGGVSAYGVGTSSSSGGGLNGSVKSYSNALKLTSESLSEIASAYSIKALDSRISSLEGGSAMDVSVSGSGNAVTAISKSGTTIIVTKGTTFLTSHQSLASYLTKTDAASLYQPKGNYLTAHQSLDGYVNAIAVSGSGNAVTAVTKSGKTITFTKGSTFSLNGHTHTFASLTSKPTSLSGYGITDGVNAVSVTGSGNAITTASISGHTLTLTKGSSFSLSNHTHYVGTTQVQGSSAEQALTGITKIDNILKLSKASVTVNTSYKAEQNRLVIYGTTYGNDANYIKSAGKLSYGDGGPQLVFSTSDNPDASGVQSAALVYTDHDTIGAGVSLSFVTNQGDAYFIAPHIKALTAFQGNLAWSYITNKPTTLSGFGITDGLRSVTQPSGSNVFVTGISTSGTAITYTKSYTKKSLSAVGTSGWTNASIDGNIIPDMSFIAYWNGAYSGTSSNLAYCNKGAFGSFAIKNSLAFSELTSKPTTISGYGITDAYTKSQVDTIAAKYLPLTGGTLTGQLKIEASALNGAYNGLRIGDDCYIGDCNFGNTIGLMGVGNNNAGMVKFGKGGMQFGYNGLNHIASTTAQWTNLNADLLDGWHKNNIVWSGAVNSNTASLSHYWAKLFDITVTDNQYDDRSFTFLFSNGFRDTYSVVVLKIRQNGAKGSGAYNFGISLRELVGNMSSRLRVYYNNATGNVQLWGNCQGQYGSLSYTIIKKTGRTSADFKSQGTLVTNTSFSAAQSLPATTGDSPYTLLDGATRIGIVNQADQLVTARTIWGQSFNGTANVSGALSGATTISASNTISTTLQNGALKIGNKLTPISAIDAQVIFNTGAAIRFGETNWDLNQWAGLKYTHSNKTIYLGIADKSVFTANSAQSNGTLKFPGIKTITPDSGARIGGSGGDLYLGNANNSNWVKVQDICSHNGSNYWYIYQNGNAHFNNIGLTGATINGDATINGNLSVTGLISNKGILPANYEFNNKGTSCYVSADALCSGITAITDSIQINQVTVQYSNDSGNSWTNYPMSNDAKFNMYASNAGLNQIYLGYNVITGNNDAEKLAQIKKNQLMFTFYVPNNCYSQVYFACVDMGQGVGVTCTVEYLNSKGVIVNTYIKYMTGWNQFNYINLSNGNTAYGVGNDDRRYIRFRFKHDQNTTALRNASINKIRIFAFTKYSFPTDRFMGHTGHIYNFDYNMNTYFPNSILAKGGVTAYQSSDIRLKQDLRKLDYLGIIKAMGGTYGFAWKKDNTRSIGWIAQHVLHNPQLKDIVETDEKGYYKINYWSPKLIATAFGAIEQVGDEVSRLKARVVFLESEVLRLSGDKEDCNKKRLDNKNINSLN